MKRVENQKVGRKRSGTLEPAGMHADGTPRFRFRVRLADGTKSRRFDVEHGLSEVQARAFVDLMQAREDADHDIYNANLEVVRSAAEANETPHEAETCDGWFKRYLPTKECGVSHRRISNFVWNKWVSPVIGHK
jgi:hypothetical protein